MQLAPVQSPEKRGVHRPMQPRTVMKWGDGNPCARSGVILQSPPVASSSSSSSVSTVRPRQARHVPLARQHVSCNRGVSVPANLSDCAFQGLQSAARGLTAAPKGAIVATSNPATAEATPVAAAVSPIAPVPTTALRTPSALGVLGTTASTPLPGNLEELASSAAAACEEARATRRTIEEQGLSELRTMTCELGHMQQAAMDQASLLESEVKTVATQFIGESEACREAMRKAEAVANEEAIRGRSLLAELAESRWWWRQGCERAQSHTIKDMDLSWEGSTSRPECLQELDEFRNAAKENSLRLVAKAADTAETCSETRMLRQLEHKVAQAIADARDRARERGKAILQNTGSWTQESEVQISVLESQVSQMRLRCEEAKSEQDDIVRTFAQRGRLLLAEHSRYCRPQDTSSAHRLLTTPQSGFAPDSVPVDDDDDSNLLEQAARGDKMLARAAVLARTGLSEAGALLSRLSDSPDCPSSTDTTVSPSASAHGLPDVEGVPQQFCNERGEEHHKVNESMAEDSSMGDFNMLRSCILNLRSDVDNLRQELAASECMLMEEVVEGMPAAPVSGDFSTKIRTASSAAASSGSVDSVLTAAASAVAGHGH